MPQQHSSPWRNPQLCERLEELWKGTGPNYKPASEIAAILTQEFPGNKFTRVAIIGRATRSGLAATYKRSDKQGMGRYGKKYTPRPRRERPEGADKRVGELMNNTLVANGFVQRLNRAKPPEQPTEAVDLPPEQSVTAKPLLDAEAGECRWPVADDGKTPMVCGAKTGSYRITYCARHARVSYTKPPARSDSYISRKGRPIGRLNRFA